MIGVQSSTTITTFGRILLGKENALFDALSVKYPDSGIYKVLGDFDVAILSENNDLLDQTLFSSYPEISHRYDAALLKWCGDYKSPALLAWIKDSPILGYIFIELDKSIYTITKSTAAISAFINHIYSDDQWSHDNVAFYGGMGHSELHCVIKTNTFDGLFSFINAVRFLSVGDILPDIEEKDKNIPLFTSTRTFPLISYKEVISNENYGVLAGDIKASTVIHCPPGIENKILDSFKFEQKGIEYALGDKDLIVYTYDKIPAKDYIRSLIKFRLQWGDEPCFISTDTTIIDSPIYSKNNLAGYHIERLPPYPALPVKFSQVNIYLANRTEEIIKRVESALANRSTYHLVLDMAHYPMRLQGAVIKFIRLIGSNKESAARGTIINLINSGEIALLQRAESRFTPLSTTFSSTTFEGSSISSTLAIEHVVDFIITSWASINDPSEEVPWHGFTFFSDSFGFVLRKGQIFSIPLEAARHPISKSINWLTITHEISHLIYMRLVDLGRIKKALFVDIARLIVDDEKDDMSSAIKYVENFFFEIFATWYDYYHFYSEDHDFFQKTIWDSWLRQPIVSGDVQEYIARSFLIYMFQKETSYKEKYIVNNHRDYIKDQYDEYKLYINQYVRDESIFQGDNKKIFDMMELFALALFQVANECADERFKILVNSPYINISSHMDSIEAGMIISDDIENPYLLLKKCKEKYSERSKNELHALSSALILSLKNQVEFLTK